MLYLSAFTDYLTFQKRYSPHTVKAYKTDITYFFTFVERRRKQRIEGNNTKEIRAYEYEN